MKNLNFIIPFFLIILAQFACDMPEDELPVDNSCDKNVIINADDFVNVETSFFELINATINDHCLEIEYSASGCDGDSWIPNLYDANEIAESLPEQRRLRFKLDNQELCLAVFTKTISFDISNLQTGPSGELILNLEDWDEALRYMY